MIFGMFAFRDAHLAIVQSYLFKPSNDQNIVGTGGSRVMEFLFSQRNDTRRALIE